MGLIARRVWMLLALACLALAGCGGGASSGTVSTPTATLSATLFDAAGAPTNTVPLNGQATLRVSLVDGNRSPIASAIITLANTSTVAVFVPASGSALTDAAGNAQINLSGVSEAADTLTVNAAYRASDGSSKTASLTLNYRTLAVAGGTSPLRLVLQNASGSTVTSLQPGIAYKAIATLTDSTGKPVPDALVKLTFDAESIEVSPPSGQILTDASGQATATVIGKAKLGAAVLGATVEGMAAATANINYQVVTGSGTGAGLPTLNLTLTNAAGAALANNTLPLGTQGRAIVTLLDGSGKPVPNQIVTFAAGSSTLSLSPTSGVDLTNASGQASISLIANGTPGADSVVATASVTLNGIKTDLSATANYKVSAGATTANPTLALGFSDANGNPVSNSSNSVTSGLVGYVSALVSNELGQPLSNQIVTFTTTGSVASFLPASGDTLTDSNGRAVIGILGSATTGAATLTASASVASQTGTSSTLTSTLNYQVIPNPNPTAAPALLLTITGAGGVEDSGISAQETLTLTARLLENNQPVAGQRVRFSLAFSGPRTAAALGTFSVTTDASGNAITTLTGLAGGLAGDKVTVTATVVYKSQTLTQAQELAYAAPIPQVDSITIAYPNGTTPLSFRGSATLTIRVVDNTRANRPPFTDPVTLTLSSNCQSRGLASFDDTTVIPDDNGIGIATYTDLGCGRNDVIVATPGIVGAIGKSQTILLSSAPAPVASTPASLQFVDAVPSSLAIRGSGGVETSVVRFRLVDGTGAPVNSQAINFSLQALTTGVARLDTTSATTDGQGLVSAAVRAGTIGGPVSVSAVLVSNPSIATRSNQLFVTTGIPHQNGFSLAATILNPEFGDFDGEETVLTARAADRYGNPVPDGTIVSFRTEGGIGTALETSVSGSPAGSCRIVNGACSVTLRSNGNRSVIEQKPGFNGRQNVVAFVIGEDSFVDSDGNGVLSTGEAFPPPGAYFFGDPYFDVNENNAYDTGEAYIPLGRTPNDGRDGGTRFLYHGLACADATSPNSRCSSSNTRFVFDRQVIVWSRSVASINVSQNGVAVPNGTAITLPNPFVFNGACVGGSAALSVQISDRNGQPMPAETTFTFAATTATLDTATFTVPNTTSVGAGAPALSLVVTGGAITLTDALGNTSCTKPLSDTLTITTTTPNGTVTERRIALQ